jgi:hypothetical protein
MSVLDLQGLESAHERGGGGGSTLTVALCDSKSPSNLSVAICH